MDLKINGLNILMTGATGGIGKEICKAFLLEKSKVFHFYRKAEKNDKLKDWLTGEGIPMKNLDGCLVDLSSEASVEEGLKKMNKACGNPNVFVHVVGQAIEKPFLLGDPEDWDKAQETNLNSAVRISRKVLKPMILARSGSIIFISTIVAWRFGRGVAPYASAKAGLNRFAEVLACEVAQKGVRVNVVCPGMINTNMAQSVFERHSGVLKYSSGIGRIGAPEEIAPAVLFLASNAVSSYITGQKIVVDGGISL